MEKKKRCAICGKSLSIYNPFTECFFHDGKRVGVPRNEPGCRGRMLGNRPNGAWHKVLNDYYGGYHE